MPQTQDAALLREAVAAAKAGNKAVARQLLRQASVHNPNNELVWLWRASLSESPKEAIFYLTEVLRINPSNQKAASWLEKCNGHQPGSAPDPAGMKPLGQNLSQPPEPSRRPAGPNVADPAARQSILRAAETVGTTTASPVEPAPANHRPAEPFAPAARVQERPSVREPEPALTAVSSRPVAAPPRPAVSAIAPQPPQPANRLSTVPAPQPAPVQPPAKWRCPFCAHPSEAAMRRCPSCKAVTALEDLREIERNEGVNEKAVREALGRYESTPAEKRTFDHNLNLALGHLNLREASIALPYLKAATAQRRNDWALLGVLDQLQWRKVVLVVDDSLTIRKALSSILEKNDFRVVAAEDGTQALERLNEAVPDLVLLDITMPWMDGYQVCKAIKEKELTKKVPVIMLSGKDGLFDKMRGKLAGCNDYVTKPFDPEALLKTIKKYLK